MLPSSPLASRDSRPHFRRNATTKADNPEANIADRQNGRTQARHHMKHLEFRRILMVATRHPQVSENKLREEESD